MLRFYRETLRRDKLFWVLYTKHLSPSKTKFFLYIFIFSILFFYVLHLAIILNSKSTLDKYSNVIFSRSEQLDFQITHGLAVAKSTQSKLCTNADIATLRKILDKYYYLGDLGRVEDNKIICTVKKGMLYQAIPLEGQAHQSSNKILFWNNQNKLFIDKSKPPTFTHGNTVAFISEAFLADLESHLPIQKGSGGYLFLKNDDYILKVFGKIINLDHIHQAHERKISLYDRLFLPGSLISTEYCQDFSNICMMTIVKDIGIFNLPYFYTLLAAILTIIFGILFAYISLVLRGGSIAFQKKLRHAIYSGKIYPAFQPKICLASSEIIGVEALARWNDPMLGNISPELFISVAEQTNLIRPLTEKFIKRLLNELKDCLNDNSDFSVSINVSSEVLIDDGFLDFLKNEVSKYKFNNKQIIIEITERTTLNSNAMAMASKLIKEYGYLVSLDDFGTGFSNLSWLTSFEPNEIKIDKMFTQAIDTETVNNITLNGIFSMIDHLNVNVVFEGIETENQLSFIRERVPEAIGQGWLFSKPIPIDELTSIIKTAL